MIRTAAFAALTVLLCIAVAPFAAAAAAEREKARLSDVRVQRLELERKLKAAESSRAAEADRLRETERAISEAGRRLRGLEEESAQARQQLGERERALRQLERQVAADQTQLARLLRHHFQPREADALAVLLAGGDPNVAARDRYFLTLLSRAKAELIAGLRHDALAMRQLAGEVRERGEKLTELSRREARERASLQQRQGERQAALARLAGEIKAQRREIETLRQDEARLGKLIETLGRKPAKPPAPTGTARLKDNPPPAGSTGNARADEPLAATGAFARMRGRLPPPVKGSVALRFGARRDDGQSVSKGIFFRAAEGADVRAVAAGDVVFADWLRGYGNLVIIDHDDGFLSVYGNNQTLLVDAGQKVGAGRTVATVGAGTGGGGSQGESGLYFELRHRGRAFDPGKWLGMP